MTNDNETGIMVAVCCADARISPVNIYFPLMRCGACVKIANNSASPPLRDVVALPISMLDLAVAKPAKRSCSWTPIAMKLMICVG